MEVGTIISWAKQEGELIDEGDVLAEVETDEATMEMDSPISGYMYIAKILVPAGSKDIPLGKVCSPSQGSLIALERGGGLSVISLPIV